jgi:hypothetical protein
MKKTITRTLLLLSLFLLIPYLTDNQLMAQSDTANFVSHYVLPAFVKGTVKIKDGRLEVAMMNYNKLTEEMIFDKEGTKLALDSLEKIDTVYLDTHTFVPHDKVFYEVLVKGRVSLFEQDKCNLLAAGNNSGYGGTTETGVSRSVSMLTNSGRAYMLHLPRDYHVTDASQFWISRSGKYYKANNASQIIKVFPEKSKEIKEFIKVHNLDLKNPADVVKLIVKCNEFVR